MIDEVSHPGYLLPAELSSEQSPESKSSIALKHTKAALLAFAMIQGAILLALHLSSGSSEQVVRAVAAGNANAAPDAGYEEGDFPELIASK